MIESLPPLKRPNPDRFSLGVFDAQDDLGIPGEIEREGNFFLRPQHGIAMRVVDPWPRCRRRSEQNLRLGGYASLIGGIFIL